MKKFLVLNDGTDEIFNLHYVEGHDEYEVMLELLEMFGTNSQLTYEELKDSIIKATYYYDVSNLDEQEIENILIEHNEKCKIRISPSSFVPFRKAFPKLTRFPYGIFVGSD